MLNEFVYCPRLFFYEHVEGVFLHSFDTLRGKEQHKRVDGGKGDLPAAKRTKKSDPDETNSGEETKPQFEPQEARDEEEIIHARSVMLGSELLGVVAKLDLVEVSIENPAPSEAGLETPPASRLAQRVRPVEYKAGAPRSTPDEGGLDLWDADRIQLGLQILLLRENGYDCDEGVVFYRQTRQRVRFLLDHDTEIWIRKSISAARACSLGCIPPPLDHSPKCPRCSLAPICLPDETRMLKGQADEEPESSKLQLSLPGFISETEFSDPDGVAEALAIADEALDSVPEPRPPSIPAEGEIRRLITPDIDTKALYVATPGVSITKKSDTVVVKEQGGVLAEVRIKDLHHLAIFGPAQLSTALVQTLCERDVPISYFSMGGWFYGLTRGHGLTNVFTRIQQFRFAADKELSLSLARLFVYGKVRNQRTLLMRNHVEPSKAALGALKHASSAALVAGNQASLLGIEGAAALFYFRQFGGMIKGEEAEDQIPGLEATQEELEKPLFSFDFKTRNRRPPKDPVNALLSFAYSLLARDCTIAAYAVGFDPYVGFYHQPRFGRPALALDIMEEFRPLIADSVVLTAINNRILAPGDFVQAGNAVNLSEGGRKRFLMAYEKRMSDTITHPIFDYKVSYRRAIELQFRLLARTVEGEISRYMPFMTR
jgi:CRISPR-associated protein Cas1